VLIPSNSLIMNTFNQPAYWGHDLYHHPKITIHSLCQAILCYYFGLNFGLLPQQPQPEEEVRGWEEGRLYFQPSSVNALLKSFCCDVSTPDIVTRGFKVYTELQTHRV
jgi:hypothetical protein